MNSGYRNNGNYSDMGPYSDGPSYNKFPKMSNQGKFGEGMMEGYSNRNSPFQQRQMMPGSNMPSQSVFQQRGTMSQGRPMTSNSSSLSGNMNSISGTSFFSSFGSDARSHFKSTFSAPMSSMSPLQSRPSLGPIDSESSNGVLSRGGFMNPMFSGSNMNSNNNFMNNDSKSNMDGRRGPSLNPGFQQMHNKQQDFSNESLMFNERNRFSHSPSRNFRSNSVPHNVSGVGNDHPSARPMMNFRDNGMTRRLSKDSRPNNSMRGRKDMRGNGFAGKKRFAPSQGLQASKKRIALSKKRINEKLKTKDNDVSQEDSGENAEKNRVSALKRLGPKLSIVDRLGNKTAKKSGDQKDNVSRSQSQEKIEEKENSVEMESSPSSSDKVICPHCGTTGDTKEDYNKHLSDNVHAKAMKQLKYRLMVTLNNMRSRQKTALEEVEKNEGFVQGLAIFCKTCKIIHHSKLTDHIETELHKCIEKFLKPTCTFCNSEFQSPMAFETHNSTYFHLKKAIGDESSGNTMEYEMEAHAFNLEDLVTVDEVGVVDYEIEIGSGPISNKKTESLNGKSKVKTTPPAPKIVIEDSSPRDTNKVQASTVKKVTTTVVKTTGAKKENVSKKTGGMKKDALESKVGGNKNVSIKKIEMKKQDTQSEKKLQPKQSILKKSAEQISDVEENEKEKVEMKLNPGIPLGVSLVKKVEALFCDICKEYLPPQEKNGKMDDDELINSHCMSSAHQSAFIEKEDKNDAKDFTFNEDELDYEPDEYE
uniref:C2H2-type domain-containing protein n=1 Tax=Lepeophtheirus salmonis TaxID=72036 RepID=A0A0K2TNX4_LEPSM